MAGEVPAAPVSKSCDDLLTSHMNPPLSRSQSCVSLSGSSKYDHVQSKIKQYFEILKRPSESKAPPLEASKEEYLEEINNRLVRELEEKNATLQQLQENYEHLLLKYAEAQNKIDNLRFQTSANAESAGSGHKRKKSLIKKLPRPIVYNYKNPHLDDCKGSFSNEINEVKLGRPSSLAVEPNIRAFEKDLKAVTPTDSEGMSSIVTSMSGHSKILTNFDDKEEEKKPALKTQVLEKTLPVFEKVTHWQNSLPPLEMIEKPDAGYFELVETPSTRYNDPPTSDLENMTETPEWTSHAMSQIGMKKYLRTLSLPSSLTRRNMLAQIYKRRNIHTIDVSSPISPECRSPSPTEDIVCDLAPPTGQINLIRRKNHPPFLRSASLPIYDYDSPRPSSRCPVPPLNLENLILTEDESESSPNSQNNPPSSPTFLSHECSFQTLDSLNSCNAASDASSHTPKQCMAIHKSTSITPDRSKQFFNEGTREFGLNCCNICGEIVNFGSASYHGIHQETKEPICRSFSFNSNESPTQRFSTGGDVYESISSDLKNRSQIAMKALTAHVKNS